MRLIDADALLDVLNNKYLVVGAKGNPDDSLSENRRLYEDIKIINEQPTAYDVEKVVEELEKLKNIECDQEYISEIIESPLRVSSAVMDAAIKRAIEIVRKGGVE